MADSPGIQNLMSNQFNILTLTPPAHQPICPDKTLCFTMEIID